MQIIENPLFTILVPEKGYKLVNKTNGKYHKKVYLGKLDSVDNYGEVLDEKYINMDYVVELDNLKNTFKLYSEQSDMTIDLLLLTIDELYNSIEPMLAMVPMIMNDELENKISNLVSFYVLMVKKGLKNIDEVPERFREQVRNII